jgi:hypothetical protein
MCFDKHCDLYKRVSYNEIVKVVVLNYVSDIDIFVRCVKVGTCKDST